MTRPLGMRVQADMGLVDLRHEAINAAANGRQLHQNVGAFIAFREQALQSLKPPAPDKRQSPLCFL